MFTCDKDRMNDKITTFSKFGDAGHGGIKNEGFHGHLPQCGCRSLIAPEPALPRCRPDGQRAVSPVCGLFE